MSGCVDGDNDTVRTTRRCLHNRSRWSIVVVVARGAKHASLAADDGSLPKTAGARGHSLLAAYDAEVASRWWKKTELIYRMGTRSIHVH